MRLLVISPFLPSPQARHGGGVYLGSLIESLAAEVEVELLTLAGADELRVGAPLPEGLCDAGVVIRPTYADRRGLAHLTEPLRNGLNWALGRPLMVSKFRSATLSRTIRHAISERRPEACLIEMSWMGQYLKDCGDCPTVLTDHEAGDPPHFGAKLGAGRDARLWRAEMRRNWAEATSLQALNQDDADQLAQRSGRAVTLRPPSVPWPERAVEPASTPPRLCFLGDYRHPPNPEAVRFVAREVMPRVRAALPEAEFWIAGPNADSSVSELAALPGVEVLGLVDDLDALLASARALVAPLFSGAGSRIKVLTALAHGLPVVSNALGLRGIDAPAEIAARGEDADSLAAACLGWLQDPARCAAAGREARAWAEAHASPRAAAIAQIEAVEAMLRAR